METRSQLNLKAPIEVLEVLETVTHSTEVPPHLKIMFDRGCKRGSHDYNLSNPCLLWLVAIFQVGIFGLNHFNDLSYAMLADRAVRCRNSRLDLDVSGQWLRAVR